MAVAASSNPITSVAPSSSPITSVPDTLYPPSYGQQQQQQQQQLLSRLTLEMRGERFVVERETLLNLPESVLLGMFPNGLILSRQQLGWPDEEDDGENQVYPIDVSRSVGRVGRCWMVWGLTAWVSSCYLVHPSCWSDVIMASHGISTSL